MNKRLAITLFLIYATLLTLVLTFGKSVSHAIITALEDAMSVVELRDVEVELKESYLVGKTISPTYTPKGRIGSDAELRFEALDDTLTVDSKTGSFKGKRGEADQTVGRIRISSEKDSSFEKIITVRFIKKYPDSFDARYIVKSYGANVSYTRVGVPIHAYCKVPSGQSYSETSFTILYDPEYFVKVNSRTLMPIKETPAGVKVSLTYVYANGLSDTTRAFSIKAAESYDSFDEIRLTNKSSSPDGTVGSSYMLTLYKDGKRLTTDYTIKYSNGKAYTSSVGRIVYKKAGKEQITVTLPNGFSSTLDLVIKNVVIAPTLSGVDEDVISLKRKDATTFPLSFDSIATYKKVTLIYDDTMLKAKEEDGKLTLTGLKLGESQLTIRVKDGDDIDERVYTIKTIPETSLYKMIKNDTSIFVYKVMGHISGFAILAFFAMNMFKYFKKRHPVLSFLHYSGCGIVFAALTEFIQQFMPQRTSTYVDVIIDMSGYYLGTLSVMALVALVGVIQGKKAKIAKKS